MTAADAPDASGPPEFDLPDRLVGERVTLRSWTPEDAPALVELVLDNIDHLKPWMSWADRESQTVDQALERLKQQQLDKRNAVYGIFFDGSPIGGCGLHSRIAPDGLEIGYWLSRHFLGRGFVTDAARLLTDAAFSLPHVTHVEIHHDEANERSGAVPKRLLFELVSKTKDAPDASGNQRTSCIWRTRREAWETADS